jgi:hypothetical protein
LVPRTLPLFTNRLTRPNEDCYFGTPNRLSRRILIDTPFAVSIIAADEILLVTLRFGAGAARDAIEAFMFQIADAFAEVERLSEKDLQDLFWEQKRLSLTEHCVVLRRKFSDPDYPQKFDAALRKRTGDIKNRAVH